MYVWYINLARRQDRSYSLIQNLRDKGVPEHAVQRFDATDRDAYETPEDLVGYATSIGFPEFQQVIGNKWIYQYLGYMVSYFRALRCIADQRNNVLLMEDDYHLNETHMELYNSFERLPPPVKFAMIGYNSGSDDLVRDLPHFDDDWQVGVPANGNSANIYTPEGAGYVLSKCKEKIDTTPECVIQQLDAPGIYSRHVYRIGIVSSPAMGKTDVMDGRWSDA